MIELRLPDEAMEALQGFLDSAEEGEVLSSLKRSGETILYFRKGRASAQSMARHLLGGRSPGDIARPVLRLVGDGEAAAAESVSTAMSPREKRFLIARRLESAVPGAVRGAAAAALAMRASPAKEQREPAKPRGRQSGT